MRATKEKVEVATPEGLKRELERQVREADLSQDDKETLKEFSSRVVLTKLDDKAVEGVYYAGPTETMEEKSRMEAAEDIANIQRLVHRTGRILSLKHSEVSPPTPNEEGEQSFRWKSKLVNELI